MIYLSSELIIIRDSIGNGFECCPLLAFGVMFESESDRMKININKFERNLLYPGFQNLSLVYSRFCPNFGLGCQKVSIIDGTSMLWKY